ncbi:AfsR/SARP family transcriptional regulator [Streptomyces sp. CAI-121]|uniref:AfsR/SARP family transcriptional regulator n=1 Tax=unclassified Streptomyces TaxID=2593676 RepID=UPI001586FA94|nr:MULTISPECIES: BTAD domain-containing putative transcriptional regulator [unclassified Streptomyces]NUV66003.1 AfsR/SARP family transcriptional regulator [Streptomyces sp. CAI-121]NUW12740.1 AfsR/SARP family transcriptional regulator [Streptomyces sp. CAI-68]
MHYCVLGTTRALRDDGTAVTLGGARLRALLTVLALRPGRTVPAAHLVDEVWDGDPPADAAGALQALVGRLRRALGHSAVESVEGGYRLAAPPDAVDLHRFERLAGEGSRALEDGDAAGALAALGEALALWNGPALADLPDRTAIASRWEARRLDARRAALGALLALGRPGEALPELAVLCDTHPLDEPLQALRIRALRDAGRPAEALAAYEEVRTLLDDRLGTAPGPALRALHTELLHPEPFPQPSGAPAQGPYARVAGEPATRSASAPAGGAAPKPRAWPHAPGGAAEPALDTATEPASHPHPTPGPGGPAPAGPPPAPGNLRARLTSFVGRDTDMAALREDLGRARLVTLLGPGGAGKTRLSQETAEAAAEAWPDGVWLAELAPVDDPDTVPEAVLTALGARETVLRGAGAEELRATDRTAADPLVRLTEHCAPRSMLLLLDNCEHVIGGAAALADQLLSHCPRLTILATSREPLGVPGEFVRPVDPLPDPMALRLFAERGAAARPGFRTDADEATAACAEICRRLDGLPLAIELAAARLRMLTPRQIADRLDDRFRLLTNGSRTVLPRQQTLRAVVDWSWDLLDDAERAVLRRLSVFAGGCSLAAAEEVCALPAGPGGPAVDSLDVAALLGSLVDKSLVVAAPGDDGEMRYRLLETVGEYAAERLAEAGERDAVERRHLVHFRELARTTGPRVRGSGQREAIAVLQREYENLRTALRHAVTARDEHEALCIVLSMAWYWMLRDLRSDAGQWSASVAALGPDPFAAPGVRAPALLEHPIDRPPPMDDDQLAEARRGAALLQLAGVDDAISTWSSPEGKERLRIIAETYRPGMPQTCRLPGTLWLFANMIAGDEDRLNTVLDETVRASRVHGGEWELGSALHTRANIRSNSPERVADARADADESLEIYTRLGDDWGAAEALAARGEANERAGRFLAALDDYREAVEYARKIGAQSQAALLRARYAGSLIELERLPEAEAILRDVIENGRHLSHEALPMARMHLAFVLGLQGQVDEARQQTHLVREDFKDRDVAIFGGFVHGVLAWLDNLDGDHVSALSNALTALESAREPLSMMVAPQMPSAYVTAMAQAIAGFAGTDAARDAVRLLGFQEKLLPQGHVPTVMERRNWALTEQAARDRLGDDAAYAAAYEEGGGLTLDEATALAETYRRAHPSA